MEAENHFLGFVEGILLMLLFGLGTMPSLFLFGRIINIIGVKMRARLYRLSAIVMIIMGIIFVVRSIHA
jgi:sulfite exporter TauE/SafE